MASMDPARAGLDTRSEIEVHLANLEQSLARVDRDAKYPEVARELRAIIEEIKAALAST